MKVGDVVYLVKYAIITGKVTKHPIIGPGVDGGYAPVRREGHLWDEHFKIGKDVFADADDALAYCETLRKKKLASLEKQIATVKAVKFEVTS